MMHGVAVVLSVGGGFVCFLAENRNLKRGFFKFLHKHWKRDYKLFPGGVF